MVCIMKREGVFLSYFYLLVIKYFNKLKKVEVIDLDMVNRLFYFF